MSIQCAWEPSYSVGDEELDRQHQGILESLNRMPDRLSADEIGPILTGVLVRANEHFIAEERRMQEMGYPRLSRHRQIHKGLIARLSEIVAHPRDGADSRFSLRELLSDWFQGHILSCDLDYARFEQARRFRPENRMRGTEFQSAQPPPNTVTKPLSDTEMENF